MKKKFLTLLLALMVALALTVPAWAEQQPGDAFVYDMAGLLSEEDDAYLEALASQISWEHNCAVYIVTMRWCPSMTATALASAKTARVSC